MPVLLIAEREFRTYVATLSFWLSLAVAPVLAGAALLFSGGGGPVQPLLVSIQGGNAQLVHSASLALEEAGRLEGKSFIIGQGGASLALSQPAPRTLETSFSDGFPLSPVARAMVDHVIERDMARSQLRNQDHMRDAPVASFVAVHEKQADAGPAGMDVAHLSRLATMIMLWLTLTGSLGMLLQAVARERANRALESLLASARAWEIVAGKLLGVGAVSLLILITWLGSAAFFSAFRAPDAGLVPAVLADFAQPLTLLRDALIYVCAFGFYGAATLVLGAMARDSASAQNVARPLFLLLLAAFFIALATPAGAPSWLTYVPPLTPFLLLVNSAGNVAVMSQAILLGILIAASGAMMLLAARLLCVAPRMYYIFRTGPAETQPLV
jgi:ABC-2 type transport system permease protein